MILLTLRWPSWWMLDDLSDVAMAVLMDARWFVWRCDGRRDCVTVLIGCPGGSVRRMRSSGIFSTAILRYDWTVLVIWSSGFCHDIFLKYFAMESPILNLDRLLDDEQYLTQRSSITVQYDLVRCSIKYVRWYWGYFWCNCDILD